MARWERELETAVAQEGPGGHRKPISYIIEKIFEEIALEIYQRDKDGNLKYNDKGQPKIAWLNVLTGVARLVGKVIFLKRIYDSERLK